MPLKDNNSWTKAPPRGTSVTLLLSVLWITFQDAKSALLPDTTTAAPEGTTLPFDDSSVLMWAIPVGVLTGVPLLVGLIICTCACISCWVSVKQNKERMKITPDPMDIGEIPDFDPENFNVDDFDLEGFLNEGMGDLDEFQNNENDVVVQDEFDDDDDPFKDDKKPEVSEEAKDKTPIMSREKTVKFAV